MQPPTDNLTLAERVRALADEAAAGTDLYVVDVAVRGREGSRVVEVYVDADAGAGLGALTDVSNRLGFLLDAEDPIAGPYTLNVSSPGADRPLALPRQYPKHVGRTLRVSYQADANDPGEEVTLTGPLTSAGAEAIIVQTREGHDVEIPYAAIREARVVLPW
jgi:ribosome maturation factor RimP